jgi:site-specific DNA-methyltransferase (adenine-specific)
MSNYTLVEGDCLDVLRELPDASMDSCVCDPPYGLSSASSEDVEAALRAWIDRKVYVPSGKGFMSKEWDAFVPGPEVWREVFRVLKPGGHLLAFAGTRTQDLMGLSIRLAGFECRDSIRVEGTLSWCYGSGFPKSLDVGKALEGWKGWGTALKPSYEPILMFRKPFEGTVAANVSLHGTGALNIDGCRVETTDNLNGGAYAETGRPKALLNDPRTAKAAGMWGEGSKARVEYEQPSGRWPPNLLLCHTPDCVRKGTRTVPGRVINRWDDGSKPFGGGAGHPYTSTGGEPETINVWECSPGCPVAALDSISGELAEAIPHLLNSSAPRKTWNASQDGSLDNDTNPRYGHRDSGGASRFFPQFSYTEEDAPFFYCAKANRAERSDGLKTPNSHPTVKPIQLLRWLIRLVTQKDGLVLDPFAGSASAGCAAIAEGVRYYGIEREPEYVAISRERLAYAELKAKGGVRNPFLDDSPPQETKEAPEAPMTLEDLFGFED